MLLAALDGVDGIIVIVILVVLVFGGSAIPKLARNLGSAKTEFEKGLKSVQDDGCHVAPRARRPADFDTEGLRLPELSELHPRSSR